MTEQEIIKYLKENRTKGVAFNFMPEEVKHWCGYNSADKIFNVYNGLCLEPGSVNRFDGRYVYYLSEDYELKHEFKPDWQEFNIDEDGYFEFEDKRYYYREDARFETENRDKFKGFGGWLYTEGGRQIWSMTPRISVRDSDITWSEPDINGEHQNGSMTPRSDVAWSEPDIESKSSISTKIRFWRYKK